MNNRVTKRTKTWTANGTRMVPQQNYHERRTFVEKAEEEAEVFEKERLSLMTNLCSG